LQAQAKKLLLLQWEGLRQPGQAPPVVPARASFHRKEESR
jgi:hypothetical protein